MAATMSQMERDGDQRRIIIRRDEADVQMEEVLPRSRYQGRQFPSIRATIALLWIVAMLTSAHWSFRQLLQVGENLIFNDWVIGKPHEESTA
ncbi:hypothetical protein [Rhizobium bangladeshense]|uniref:hypothetical protein n=1 Tax=Rhizobium bangladeshense TaxID=1138189 RepID=UPI0007E5B46E|nr:hypothetical protein [Rhizobium bangladeshense]